MIPVHEQFHSWQGEGVHAGRSAWFIRTFGCPVQCPWCDSAGTWHPHYVPDKIERFAPEDLAERAAAARADFVVITGGEPTVHDLKPLTTALRGHGLRVHLETSGAFPLRGDFDWITLSPKRWKPPLNTNWPLANELKLIIDASVAFNEWQEDLSSIADDAPVWLHPEWSLRQDGATLFAITQWIKTHGHPYRAGWQLHKCYQADQHDPGSQAPAPLGGNPAKGW